MPINVRTYIHQYFQYFQNDSVFGQCQFISSESNFNRNCPFSPRLLLTATALFIYQNSLKASANLVCSFHTGIELTFKSQSSLNSDALAINKRHTSVCLTFSHCPEDRCESLVLARKEPRLLIMS